MKSSNSFEAAPSTNVENHERYYNEGMSLYDKGNYKDAIKSFFIARLSEDYVLKVKAAYYLGQSYYALKQYPNATACFHYIENFTESLDRENNQVSDLIICAHHYKGNTLYALQKYQGAIKSFNQVPDEHKLALVANLYKGFCYEHSKVNKYTEAESCYTKILELYSNSNYEDKDTIKDMAQRALTVNLIHQNKIDKLIVYTESFKENIDSPDFSGNTLLMYATTHTNHELIEKLIEKGCNPFKADKFGNSAFSIALKSGNERLAKTFFEKFYQNELDNFSNRGDFAHYIAVNICNQGSGLKEFFNNLGLDNTSKMTCFNAAESYCESLGQDAEELMSANDLI